LEEEPQRNSQSKAVYQTWIKAQIDLALSPAVPMKFEKDGISLVKISREISSQEIFNKYDFPPLAQAKLTNIGYYQLLSETSTIPQWLWLFWWAYLIPADVARTIFHDLISDLADCFSLCSVGGEVTESNKSIVVLTQIPAKR
jgi:hypothetical protein